MSNLQIVTLFEQDGLTPEEIAEGFPDLDVEAIRLTLLANSAKFRAQLKEQKENGYTEADADEARMVIRQLMYAESEAVRLRAAKTLIDEKKGRNDIKLVKNGLQNVNVNLIQVTLARAKEAVERARSKVVDIPSEVQHLAAVNE